MADGETSPSFTEHVQTWAVECKPTVRPSLGIQQTHGHQGLCFGDNNYKRGPRRHHTVDFGADGNKPVDSKGHTRWSCRVHAIETIINSRSGGLLDFPEKSVTKVYNSMPLALRGLGVKFSRKNALRNT